MNLLTVGPCEEPDVTWVLTRNKLNEDHKKSLVTSSVEYRLVDLNTMR